MKLKKNLLLWNYWANLNQTLLKLSLGDPLSKLCPSAPSCIQDGRHDKKMEISSNGRNCSILSQKVPKFELYKHNDELFNIYYGIFYELWTFAYFDRLCKLEKSGDGIKKKSSPLELQPISTKLCWNDSWVVLFQNVSGISEHRPRWPPQPNLI